MVDPKLLAKIVDDYPYPIAEAYRRSLDTQRPESDRFMAMLDCVERLADFFMAVVLHLYLQQPKEKRDEKWDYEIFKSLFIQGNLSFGTIVALAIETAKRLQHTNCWFLEVILFLKEEKNSKLLRDFVTLRNNFGHSKNRESFGYELENIRPNFNELLNNCSFLKDIVLAIPDEINDKKITKIQFLGANIIKLPVEIECKWMNFIVHRSILAYSKSKQEWVFLYPFLVFSNNIVHCISQIECNLKNPAKITIKSVKYSSYDSANSNQKVSLKEEISAMEDILNRLEIPHKICIRSFEPDFKDTTHKEQSIFMDLREYFDGRFLKDGKSWEDIVKEIQQFFHSPEIKQLPNDFYLFFDCHLSIAFLLGHLINPKSGKRIIPTQKNKSVEEEGYEVWKQPAEPKNGFWQIEKSNPQKGREIIVKIPVANPIDGHVEKFLQAHPELQPCPQFTFSPKKGESQKAILNYEEVWQSAWELKTILSKNLPSNCEKIHLFFSVPVAQAYILGNVIRCIVPEIQLYEHDFEGMNREVKRYIPSILVRGDMKL